MYLLAFSEFDSKGKHYRVATIFDPNARRKVQEKFLSDTVIVPMDKIVSATNLAALPKIDVIADLSGNVVSIS